MSFKKLIALVLLFTNICFGINDSAPTVSAEQALFVSSEKMPTKLYKNQIFEIRLKALLASNDMGTLNTTLANHSGIKLLNSNYKWKLENDGSFILSLYFKTLDSAVKLPDIHTSFTINGVEKESSEISGVTMEAQNINETPKFCGVAAASLSISNYKIDGYDNTNNILAIDIFGKYANIDDFKLKNVSLQGINSVKNSFDSAKMFYYVIIPETQTNIEFEYFNTEKGEMQTVSLALDLSKIEDKVSTQTDLQPKSSDKALYVFLTVAVIASILYGIYYFKREKIFLILIIVTVVAGVVFLFIPNEQVKIKKDTVVYLLPTENSTPFFQAASDIPVEKLKESEGYIKIKMQDGKIGWVKGESIVGN